jgi:hypothetical protein
METEALERRILEELIYERVRASLDVAAIFELQEEVERSIERAAAVGQPVESAALDYLVHAWERLSEELLAELSPDPSPSER